MIQLLDANERELTRYRLQIGENRFGSDPKKCQFVIKNLQDVLFCVALVNRDVYLLHLSQGEQVFKDSTLKPYEKVPIPRNCLVEMHTSKSYYFQNYRFKLIDDEIPARAAPPATTQVVTTQLIQEFSGTMVLDDLVPEPQQEKSPQRTIQMQTATQVLNSQDCASEFRTQLLDDFPPIEPADYTFEDLLRLTQKSTVLSSQSSRSTQDSATQTDLQFQEPPAQKKPSIFSGFFGKSKSVYQPTFQREQPTEVSQPPVQKQTSGTIIDEELSQAYNNGAGTVPDMDLEMALSSQNKLSEQKLSQPEDQPQIKIPLSLSQKPAIGDLLGAFNSNQFLPAPAVTAPQPVQKKPMKGFLIQKAEIEKVKEEEIKNNVEESSSQSSEQAQKSQNQRKKKLKNNKQNLKHSNQLKKITDQVSSSSSSDEEKQNHPRQTASIELPKKKNLEEELPQKKVPNKRRGLRKLHKQSKYREVHTIAFSGYEELPDTTRLQELGLSVVSNQNEKFDVLVLKEAKRTYKFLLALMYGAYIVSEEWLHESISNGEVADFESYAPESKEFTEQFGNTILECLKARDDYMESHDNVLALFDGQYFVEYDAVPSKGDIEKLIELGGGRIVKKANKKTMVVSESKKGAIKSDQILDTCMFI